MIRSSITDFKHWKLRRGQNCWRQTVYLIEWDPTSTTTTKMTITTLTMMTTTTTATTFTTTTTATTTMTMTGRSNSHSGKLQFHRKFDLFLLKPSSAINILKRFCSNTVGAAPARWHCLVVIIDLPRNEYILCHHAILIWACSQLHQYGKAQLYFTIKFFKYPILNLS